MGVEFEEVTGTVDSPRDSSREGDSSGGGGAGANQSPDAAKLEIAAAMREAEHRAVRVRAT